MRIIQGQDIRQSNLCSYPLHLFEQRDLRVALLGHFLHPRVVFLDALLQRSDFVQQRLQNVTQLRPQFTAQPPPPPPPPPLPPPLPTRLPQPSPPLHHL